LTQQIIELTKVYRNLASFAEAIHHAEQGMTWRRHKYEARAQRVKAHVFQSLLQAGLEEVACPELEIRLRNHPPAVIIDPLADLPAEYLRVPPPVPDKVRIKAALQVSESLPGCRLAQQKRLVIE
jgi:hypothetical protein